MVKVEILRRQSAGDRFFFKGMMMLKVDRDRDGYTNFEEYLNTLCPTPR